MGARNVRRLTRVQLQETIRLEARRALREDTQGLHVRDVLRDVEDSLRQTSTKVTTVAHALQGARDDVAARKVAEELAGCLQGLRLALEKIGRARSRVGG